MKAEFPEFYRTDDAQLKSLINDSTIVLDTNVLLGVYRTPKAGREALLQVLEKLQRRIWIPHQVGLEFQMNRATVIGEQRKLIDDTVTKGVAAIGTLEADIKALELNRREIEVKEEELLSTLNGFKADLARAMDKVKESMPALSLDDPIRQRLDKLLEGRVGPAYRTQGVVDEIYKRGGWRYDNLVPPGFKDKDKTDCYVHRGILYQRKYGDLLLWQQILDRVAASKAPSVIFVTSDNKEDWWQRTHGMTLGPLPALIAEMQEAGTTNFWAYNLPQFLAFANDHLNAGISDVAVEQVNEAVSKYNNASSTLETIKKWMMGEPHAIARNFPSLNSGVAAYFAEHGYVIVPMARSHHDFLVGKDGEFSGVTIVHVADPEDVKREVRRAAVRASIARYRGKEEQEVERSILVVVLQELPGVDLLSATIPVLDKAFTPESPFTEAILGALDEHGVYRPSVHLES
jgi:PIN like domain